MKSNKNYPDLFVKDPAEAPDFEPLVLPVKTREIIALEYGINSRTLRRWCLREQLVLPASSLTPKYQRLIYQTFGTPPLSS